MRKIGPITIEQRGFYEERLAKHTTVVSEHTFTNHFVWRRTHPFFGIDVKDTIITYEERDEGPVLFCPPIGPLTLAEAARELAEALGKRVVGFERVGEREMGPHLNDGWEVATDRDFSDYVYRREDLAELAGRNYHKKRNLVSQCLAEHDCTYEELGGRNAAEGMEMMQRWCDYRKCKGDRGLCSEFQATKELFENYGKLGVVGAAIRIDGRIEAFTVGERLNENTVVIHFEKAMPQYKGLYQVINQWFCKNSLADFEFVNREQDLGIPGLRKAKESYYPDHMITKYIIYPKGHQECLMPRHRPDQRCLDEEG